MPRLYINSSVAGPCVLLLAGIVVSFTDLSWSWSFTLPPFYMPLINITCCQAFVASGHVDEPKHCFTPQEGCYHFYNYLSGQLVLLSVHCMVRTAGEEVVHQLLSMLQGMQLNHTHCACVTFMSASLPVLSAYTANVGAGLLYSCSNVAPMLSASIRWRNVLSDAKSIK